MSMLWSSSAETGILRKSDQKDRLDELLVFGYACKLFRDDDKALEIDQGKHLIPWMGDNALKIDRYDGRGALSDLSSCEAGKEGYDATRWLGLSEAERHIEQLCDEERYYSLKNDDDEDELYKEEEQKRLKSRGQVQYNYDVPENPEGPTLPEEDDEPFTPPPELDVPVNITVPTTVKQNARIEKTALFISKEGPQMEILLKTKQAGNPQFGFLTQDDPLYRYYRHVLMAFKTGRYKAKEDKPQQEQEEQKKEDGHYLHPSLAPVPATEPVATLPTVSYKPSANCAYSQLVNRIQGNQPTHEAAAGAASAAAAGDQSSAAAAAAYGQAYLQLYQQYGCYPQYDQSHPYYAAYMQGMTYDQYQMQYSAYVQQHAQQKQEHNPYAQIVSNVKAKTEPLSESKDTATQNGTYPAPRPDPSDANDVIKSADTGAPQPTQPAQKAKHIFSLTLYSGSESESEDDDQDSNAQAVVIPPSDVQIIIDKMASYVAKNGPDFENIVKSKGDLRFIFLEATHVYNPYYKYKLKECGIVKEKSEAKKTDADKDNDNLTENKQGEKNDKKLTKVKDKKIITPVCFSIKKPRDSDSVSRDRSALPVEDSSDEADDKLQSDAATATTAAPHDDCFTPPVDRADDKADKESDNIPIIEIEDPIMELIDLTEDIEEKKDAKRAENRLKDRLAAAAREKLAAKNRALQMERKKRAAAFLSQLNTMNHEIRTEQEEAKNSQISSPEEGEINGDSQNEENSRIVYYVDAKSPVTTEKEHRSRSRSKSRHKSSRHKRKSYKRSHSHSRKRKRERRSREHKKSKKRYRSRSRSHSRTPSKHRKGDRRDTAGDAERHKPRQESDSTDTEPERNK